MDIAEKRTDSALLVGPKGRLDSQTSKAFEDYIMQTMNTEKAIIISFAELNYISSAGLRVLLMAAKRAKASQLKLALSAISPAVRDVFEMSGFVKLFTIYADDDEALAAM